MRHAICHASAGAEVNRRASFPTAFFPLLYKVKLLQLKAKGKAKTNNFAK
jgi:hypothetical protein